MTREMELLLSASEGDTSVVCILADLLTKLAAVVDGQTVSNLAADYMKALNEIIAITNNFCMKDFTPGYFPFSFRFPSEPLLQAIDVHLFKRITSLKETGFKDRT